MGLCLSRRSQESITLRTPTNGSIVITIIAVDRGKVRLLVDAPQEVEIYRSELLNKANGKNNVALPPVNERHE